MEAGFLGIAGRRLGAFAGGFLHAFALGRAPCRLAIHGEHAGLSWLAEGIGLQGGWLFASAYRYHPDIHVVLPGGVPAFIPLAWFTLACFPVMVLRGMPSARPDGTRDLRRLFYKSGLAAVGMVGCDLTLDPVAVSLGLWTWERPVHILEFPG